MKKKYFKTFLLLLVIFISQIQANAEISYNAVLTNMEKHFFGIEYLNQDENQRLVRLEKNIYGANFNNSGLSKTKRVYKIMNDINYDLLGKEIKPQKDSFLTEDEIIADNTEETPPKNIKTACNLNPKTEPNDKELNIKNVNKIKRTSSQYMDENYKVKLTALEKSILSKDFSKDNNEKRISRLEKNIFNKTFAEDVHEDRISRIDDAYKATPSIKNYNSNRKSRVIATAIEAGTILLTIIPFLL